MRVVTLAAELWARGRTKRGSKGRRVQFEPLEVRALLSVSPAGGLDALGPDPAVSVLAASAMSGQTTPYLDTLTAEQAQVREDLRALLSRGGTIGELEGFQPVLMPEAFLDELYETYGDDLVWDSLGPGVMDELFGGETLIRRDETRYYLSQSLESLQPEQTRVREELHGLLSRGGKIEELKGFQPVRMPEAFLDELYDTYGPGTVWTSLGGRTLVAMFGNGDWLNRPDTPNFPQPLVDESALSLTPEQASVREAVHDHISRGGNPYDLVDFRPVRMPEAFLDELYDTYGVDAVWDSLGPGTMGTLFSDDILLFRRPWSMRAALSLTPEQASVRETVHDHISRGGNPYDLVDFRPVRMPEAFLDELYDTYGVDAVWDLARARHDGNLVQRRHTPLPTRYAVLHLADTYGGTS